MTKKVGIIMDPISAIAIHKDSTFAMLLEAQRRGWTIVYFQQENLFVRDGQARGVGQALKVADNIDAWYKLEAEYELELSELDVLLMRKDPPFNMNYLFTTYVLELAEAAGVVVVNAPQALRDANEKFFTAWFPDCCAPTLITANKNQLKKFWHEFKDIILKPLDGMGGYSIFRVNESNQNFNVICELLTQYGKRQIMAQKYLAAVREGDKRILLIDSQPIPYGLARIASPGETRANLATGGTGKGVKLTAHDYALCEKMAPILRRKGLIFVGLDVIGDFVTEINVTSPTCIRELDSKFDLNISAKLFDCIESKL